MDFLAVLPCIQFLWQPRWRLPFVLSSDGVVQLPGICEPDMTPKHQSVREQRRIFREPDKFPIKHLIMNRRTEYEPSVRMCSGLRRSESFTGTLLRKSQTVLEQIHQIKVPRDRKI
jgi:hypothetical protein